LKYSPAALSDELATPSAGFPQTRRLDAGRQAGVGSAELEARRWVGAGGSGRQVACEEATQDEMGAVVGDDDNGPNDGTRAASPPSGVRDRLPVAAVAFGGAAVAAEAVGLTADISGLVDAGVVAGICAIVLARVVRRRAVAEGNAGRATMGRVAQLAGWLSVAPVIAFVLLFVLFIIGLVVILQP
jgi:hypothetical protein